MKYENLLKESLLKIAIFAIRKFQQRDTKRAVIHAILYLIKLKRYSPIRAL